jgi:cation:H+ antiporter
MRVCHGSGSHAFLALRREGIVIMLHVVLLLGCAAVIYLACEWFVNAVEWLGVRLKVGTLAVGTVLAAIGTALPESVVTLVAVTLGHSEQSRDIGVGAAMGGPLVLATIAYGVTGALLLTRQVRRRAAARTGGGSQHGDASITRDPTVVPHVDLLTGIDGGRLARDQTWFLAIFVVKVGLGLVAFAIKPWLGLAFFAAYGVYFIREMRDDAQAHSDADLEPLKIQPRRARPTGVAIAAQTLATLGLIFAASQLFVTQLEWAGPALGLPASVTALLLSPIATELPEIMNAVIWVRQGKTQLALANISGAMMIQATVPSGLGLLFTPWLFDAPLLLSGLVTITAIVYLLVLLRRKRFTARRLSYVAGLYAFFAVGLVVIG